MDDPFLLLVDADPDDVFLTLRALEKSLVNLPLRTLNDGEDAREYLRDCNHLPLAVLVKPILPRLTGYELVAELDREARTKELPIIVLTDSKFGSELVREWLPEKPTITTLRLPLDIDSLAEALERVGVKKDQLLVDDDEPDY